MSGFKTFPDYVKDPAMPFGVRYIGTNIVLNNPSFPLGFETINLPIDAYCEEGVKYTPKNKFTPNNSTPNNSTPFLLFQQMKKEKKT
jgi:hypothetical protein